MGASNVEIRAKLPKLEMQRFNGRPTEWQAFIEALMNCLRYSIQKLRPGKGVTQWQWPPLRPQRENTHTSPLHQLSIHCWPQRVTCTFRKQDHKSVDCVVVTNVGERKDIRKQGRCFICLKRSHIARNCDSKRSCSNCSQRHHPSLCMANETPASDNSVAGVSQPSTQGSRQPSSAVSMYVESRTSILLQTCIAFASNPTSVQPPDKHFVRIILDSGSRKTYITQKLKDQITTTLRLLNLCLKNVDNDVTVTITALVVPMICSPLNYQAVQFAKRNHGHLKDIACRYATQKRILSWTFSLEVISSNSLYYTLIKTKQQTYSVYKFFNFKNMCLTI